MGHIGEQPVADHPAGAHRASHHGLGARVVLALFAAATAIVSLTAGLVQNFIGVFILSVPAIWFARTFRNLRLTGTERDRMKALGLLFLASAVFWMIYDQGGSTISLFAETHTRDSLFGIHFPSSFFQSVNPVFILALAPVIASLWMRLGSRQPSTPIKFSLGLLLVGVSFLVMVGAANAAGDGATAATWLICVYFIPTVGELCLSPVGVSTATKLAPAATVGTTMGVWFLSISVGDVIGGWASASTTRSASRCTSASPARWRSARGCSWSWRGSGSCA